MGFQTPARTSIRTPARLNAPETDWGGILEAQRRTPNAKQATKMFLQQYNLNEPVFQTTNTWNQAGSASPQSKRSFDFARTTGGRASRSPGPRQTPKLRPWQNTSSPPSDNSSPIASLSPNQSPPSSNPAPAFTRGGHARSLPTLHSTSPPKVFGATTKRSWLDFTETPDLNTMRLLRKENNNKQRARERKYAHQKEIRQKQYVKKRERFKTREEDVLAREVYFGTHDSKQRSRLAVVENKRKERLLRVLPVHKCFDKNALRARRARELMESELKEFNQSLPSKEAVKAQEAAAFRAGLNILRAAKAKKSGNYARTLKPKPHKSGKLCIRFSAHNLPRVPDSNSKEMMSNLMGGIIKVQKSGLAQGFSKMVLSQQDREHTPAVSNPSHSTHQQTQILNAISLGERMPVVKAKLYQRSTLDNFKHFWYCVGETGPMSGVNPDFNLYFNFVNRSGEDPNYRLRIFDWKNDQATHVLGSIEFETSTVQDAVEGCVEQRAHELRKVKKEAEGLGLAVSSHVGDERLRRLKDRWVQLMFTVDYPESLEFAGKLEEIKSRVSLHCKLMGPHDIQSESSLNVEPAYEVHAPGCQYDPFSKKARGGDVDSEGQLYFEKRGDHGYVLKFRGAEFTRQLVSYYKGRTISSR